jgi:hypothetical protein
LFNSQDSYNKFFNYDNRNQAQKDVLDSFFKTQSEANLKAKADADRYTQLGSMSVNDLMSITDPNDISLINQDPNLQAKYQKAQDTKAMMEFVY